MGESIELWDLFDENRKTLNRTVVRGGERFKQGEYHVIIEIWTVNSIGEILVTLRDYQKEEYPDKWENTGGSALAGETSRTAAIRELREETGIEASEDELIFLGTAKEESAFVDMYLLKRDVRIEDIALQDGETVDAKWVTLDTLDKMRQDLTLALPIGVRLQYIRKELEKYIPLLSAQLAASD